MKARCVVSGIALRRRDFVSWGAQERERRKRETKRERGRRVWGKNVRVRTVGGDPCKRAPPPKEVHWRSSALGVPATPTQTPGKKNRSRQGGDQPSALEGRPWESLLPGRARSPGPASARSRGGPSSACSRKHDKSGTTQTKEKRNNHFENLAGVGHGWAHELGCFGIIGAAEMTRILSDNNSRVFTAA